MRYLETINKHALIAVMAIAVLLCSCDEECIPMDTTPIYVTVAVSIEEWSVALQETTDTTIVDTIVLGDAFGPLDDEGRYYFRLYSIIDRNHIEVSYQRELEYINTQYIDMTPPKPFPTVIVSYEPVCLMSGDYEEGAYYCLRLIRMDL
jgi:hypothetical protein